MKKIWIVILIIVIIGVIVVFTNDNKGITIDINELSKDIIENIEFEDEELMEEYVTEVSEIVENKMQISADIVTTDYYAQLPQMLIIE